MSASTAASGSTSDDASRRPAFVSTHWSVVLTAGHSDTTRARDALEKLCRTYWYPLYAYVRRRGYKPEDAADLTQEFFARLLGQQWLAQADQERGRFRSFLLGTLNHFLANEWRKERTQKRGGDVQMISLQLDAAESRYDQEPADYATPEQHFERRWAVTLLDEVLSRLEAEFVRDGKEGLFTALKPCLVGERSAQPYAAVAAKRGLTESAVKVTVHRMRQRYRRLLREEVAQTVASDDEVEAEMRHLIHVLAGG